MKKKVLSIMAMFLCPALAFCQHDNAGKDYRNFPFVVGIQFHSLSFPFKNIKSNFANVGFRIGTELSLSGRQQDWAQGFYIGWYHNHDAGNGFFGITQTIYRPTISGDFSGEVKAGIGFMQTFHPNNAFKSVNGDWVNVGKKGKTMLVIPVSAGFGYNGYKSGTYVAPYINYELFVQKNYNKDIPFAPNTFITLGTRVHYFGK